MKSFKLLSLSIISLALVAMVLGCATTREIAVPEMKLASEMPAHAQQVANALVMRLGHAPESEVAAKTGVNGTGRMVAEEDFKYPGFQVRQIKFSKHVTSPEQPGSHRVVGYIHMQDKAGRNASATFASEYNVMGDQINLIDSAMIPLFSKYPETEMFVVPQTVLLGAPEDVKNDYGRFYGEIIARALPMRQPGAVSSSYGDYAIVVFNKDRISPHVDLEIWPSHTDEKINGKIVGDQASTTYRFFDTGWVVGVIPANFSLASETPFWIKAVCQDDNPSGQKAPYLVGLFSSNAQAAMAKGTTPGGHSKSAVNQASLPKVVVVPQK